MKSALSNFSGLSRIAKCSTRFSSTHFGYERVSEEEKAQKVKTVFASVATKYDLMNDAMSLRVHRFWKDYFVYRLGLYKDAKVIDVAGGTGDIAFRMIKSFQSLPNSSGSVTVLDINQNMLDVGKTRAEEDPSLELSRLAWVCADAEKIPFDSNSFDFFTIAFGIRNCIHVDKVIEEANRVLRPGGKFACLEFSQANSLISPFYNFYSFQVIPVMGQLLAGDYNSYKYLVESIRVFPDQETFAQMITDAGFEDVAYENLSCGICAIHQGTKPLSL